MRFRKKGAAIAVLTAAAVVVGSPGAWALDVKASLVKATKTSEWDTPSPDPSGHRVQPEHQPLPHHRRGGGRG